MILNDPCYRHTPVVTLRTMLEPFGIPFEPLADFCNKSNAVIGGSLAIATLVADFPRDDMDMDIFSISPFYIRYSMGSSSKEVVAYFKSVSDWFAQYEYIEDSTSSGRDNDYDFTKFISKVQTFKHISNGKKVDFVHITCDHSTLFSNTDFSINDTYIKFQNINMVTPSSPVYREEYISFDYENLINKRFRLYDMYNIFRTDFGYETKQGPNCPLNAITAPKRLARLEKYLARGFTMIPMECQITRYPLYKTILVNEESYRTRLTDFM